MVAGGVTVDVCKGGCGGIWFDNFEPIVPGRSPICFVLFAQVIISLANRTGEPFNRSHRKEFILQKLYNM